MPQLAPSPKFRAVGADGLALVGGKLYSYIEGTSTPKATYTSFTLGASNTNPIILDARGEAEVWLDGSYKLVLTDAADVTIWTVDSIRDLTQNQTFTGATLAGTLTVSSTAVTWSGNPTHSGNHTFSGNVTVSGNATLNGNSVIGNASSDTLTVAPNAVTWSNNPTHSGNHTFSSALTLTNGVNGIKVGNVNIADASTFDWYLEGTWTPTFNFGGGTVGMSFTYSDANYVRRGNRVRFEATLTLTTKGSSTGSAEIGGLPTSMAVGATGHCAFGVRSLGGFASLAGSQYGAISGTTILLYQTTATGATNMNDTHFTSGSSWVVVGEYRV